MEDNVSLLLASARHASTFISNRLKIECREKSYWKKASMGEKKDGKGSLTVENHTSPSKISKLSIRQFQTSFLALQQSPAELISTKLKKYRCRYFISIAQAPSVNTKQKLFSPYEKKNSEMQEKG